jgi:hypothetical protein
MKTIQTRTILVNFEGKDLKNEKNESLNVGIALSNIILSDDAIGTLKGFSLAKRFYDEETVDLDDADFKSVETSVDNCKIYGKIVTGQLLMILGEIK